jgi:hypothetical protein
MSQLRSKMVIEAREMLAFELSGFEFEMLEIIIHG